MAGQAYILLKALTVCNCSANTAHATNIKRNIFVFNYFTQLDCTAQAIRTELNSIVA